MKKVIVREFGEPDVLDLMEAEIPEPGPGQVRVALTSIGMNHADLMARRGDYKMSSGPTPFTPGIEGGGIVEALGQGVTSTKKGDRVILCADAPRLRTTSLEDNYLGGTYRTHYLVPENKVLVAPSCLPDEQLGAIWLTYLTSWGCLVWKQKIKPGQYVGIPAASSGVALAAAQIVKDQGAIPIALTSSPEKADQLQSLPTSVYDHFVITHREDGTMRNWHRQLRVITKRQGVDVYFDPVAAGAYLDHEIQSLAGQGTIWIYGLLGKTGPVDVTPLIRKLGSIRGWLLHELSMAPDEVKEEGYRTIFERFEKGIFKQHVAKTFPLEDVRLAHEEMQKGNHIGKLILIP